MDDRDKRYGEKEERAVGACTRPVKRKKNYDSHWGKRRNVNRTALFPFSPVRRFCIYGFPVCVLSVRTATIRTYLWMRLVRRIAPSCTVGCRLCCDAKSCPSTNKLSRKNAARMCAHEGSGTRLFLRARNTRGENCATPKSRVPRCRYTATSTFARFHPRVKGRNREREEETSARMYRAFYNFAGWIGIKFQRGARARRSIRALSDFTINQANVNRETS